MNNTKRFNIIDADTMCYSIVSLGNLDRISCRDQISPLQNRVGNIDRSYTVTMSSQSTLRTTENPMKFWQFGSTTAETGNAHHMGLGSTGGGCSNELIFLTSHYGGGDYHAFCWDTSTITQFNAGEWYHMVFVWNTTDSKSIVNEYINSDCSVTSENYPCPQGEVCSQLPGGNGVACRQYEIKKGVCKETNLLNEK